MCKSYATASITDGLCCGGVACIFIEQVKYLDTLVLAKDLLESSGISNYIIFICSWTVGAYDAMDAYLLNLCVYLI